jgi:hypothetical protein
MKEESSAGEDLPRGPNFVSPKGPRVRRMPENYASKSALDKEGLLLDDSERFGPPPGLHPSSPSGRGPSGRAGDQKIRIDRGIVPTI